ncbi:MAG: YfhO family protein, partial [Thermoanaerobaculia bacterium]|nr:YfhO family protein [Thermoanaerobaculia bacterium]
VSAWLASTFPGSDPQAAAAGISASLRHAAAVAAALALVLAARGLQHRRWQVGALVAVVGIDLLLAGRPVNQTAPAALLVEPPAALGPVLEHLGTGRLYSAPSPREIQLLAPPTNELWWRAHWRREILDGYRTARYGVPVVLHGDHSLAPARSVALAGALPHLPWQERIPLLSAAGATVLVSADDPAPELEAVAEIPNQSDRIYRIYRNDKAIDGATFVATWLAAGSGGEAMAAMRGAGFDPRRHTVVEGVAASSGDPCTEPAAIDWRRRDPRRWSLDVDTSCPGYLVFSEPFYPDWKVEVDGTEAPLRRANFAFSAVALEPGRHRVERIYRPSRVLAGALITLLTLAAVAAWLARPLRYAPAAPEKRKRPPKRAPSNRR